LSGTVPYQKLKGPITLTGRGRFREGARETIAPPSTLKSQEQFYHT